MFAFNQEICMKKNNFLIILTLCAGLQSPTWASELEVKKSYWQTYAPIWIQNKTTATADYLASWIPQSVIDTVNSWSTRKKVAVASAIIASLAAIYNKDYILALVNNAIDAEPEHPNKYNFENEVKKVMDILGDSSPIDIDNPPLFTPQKYAPRYIRMHPEVLKDPAFNEAMQRMGLKYY